MLKKIVLLLTLGGAVLAAAGCVPVALGVGGAVIADEAAEQEHGGDGLF